MTLDNLEQPKRTAAEKKRFTEPTLKFEEANRKCRSWNTTVQLSTCYTDHEHHNVTDRAGKWLRKNL